MESSVECSISPDVSAASFECELESPGILISPDVVVALVDAAHIGCEVESPIRIPFSSDVFFVDPTYTGCWMESQEEGPISSEVVVDTVVPADVDCGWEESPVVD